MSDSEVGELRRPDGWKARMFLFFSSRLGCLGSLLLSGTVTVLLLAAFGMIRL